MKGKTLMGFPERVRKLRIDRKMTQEELGKKINVSKVSVSGYETGNRTPDMDTLQKLSDVLDVSMDYLLGRSDLLQESRNPYYALSKKDERDIAKDLARMMESLEGDEALAFHGERMDEETKRLIQISLENSMRLAKEMAKKKFTPKRYRKEED